MSYSIALPVDTNTSFIRDTYQKVADFFSNYFTRKTPETPQQPEGKLEKGLSDDAGDVMEGYLAEMREILRATERDRFKPERQRGYH